ncbi:MAG TPA: tryptophan synthase subunit alpha [Gammaproteobacteria bacterium]
MSRLGSRLDALRAGKRTALVAYLVAGDPSATATVKLMHALVEGGADVIEVGVPFTDPVADGPVIQAACERALRAGTRLRDVFEIVREFRRRDAKTPVVLMGYLNPLEAVGYATFAQQASAAGADGLLIVDLPAEEGGELENILRDHDLERVCLVAPTTSDARLARICRSATGFVYYVSLKGVTGAGNIDANGMQERLARIRALTDRPVGIGFGITDASTAVRLAQIADAVIVGSMLVRHIARHGDDAAGVIRAATAEIRQALDLNAVDQRLQ